MFDRTHVSVTRGPSRVDVHEHRAPTDASVKLLTEMEEKAEARVVARMRLDSNDFKGFARIEEFHPDQTYRAVAIFDLNGKRLTAEVTVGFGEARRARGAGGGAGMIWLKLRDKMAEVVAANMLADFVRTGPKF